MQDCHLCGNKIHPDQWEKAEALYAFEHHPVHLRCYLSGRYILKKTAWLLLNLRRKYESDRCKKRPK